MSWLRREFGVAPRTGVTIALFMGLVAAAAFSFAALGFPLPLRVCFAAVMGFFVFVYALLVAYVYGDARRRGMRHVVWTLVAALVPNAMGIIAYFLLREPLLKPCAACGTPARRGFAFCTRCGAPLAQTCAACRRALDPGWTHCAHCGAPVGSAAAMPVEA
jgi:hypothetical protein